MTEHYDLIVIGSGPGGASLAQRLAPSGKRILILERGDYLPREEANWSSKAVFVDAKYQAAETWTNAEGDTFHPALHYYVGGNSMVYGAALFRLRERDFDEILHAGGVSPAWPLKYAAFATYYDEAETLFHVHGNRGEDPVEPPTAKPYPFTAVKLDKRFWAQGDFWSDAGGKGRGLFWEFLENQSLGAGFLLIVVVTDRSGLNPFLTAPLASSHPYGSHP